MIPKIAVLIVLLLSSTQSYAQRTFFYHCSKRIHADGVVEKMDHIRIFTISGDSLYESDEDGNIKYFNGVKLIYKYYETIDGNRYYYSWTPPVSGFGMMPSFGGYDKGNGYIVSSDYSVINSFYKKYGLNYTDVYYLTTEETVRAEKNSQIQGLIR